MDVIGKGLFSIAYNLGNGRVLKKPTSDIERFYTLVKWSLSAKPAIHPYREVKRLKIQSMVSFTTIKTLMPFMDTSIIGNPVFKSRWVYEQDKVLMVKPYLKDNVFKDTKGVVDSYIKLILEKWSYGFMDSTFNFTVNNGFNRHGELIQIDLNELVFDKEEILRRIQEKRWLRAYSCRTLKDEKLKRYFESEMEKNLTERNLNRLWKKKCKDCQSIP